MSVVAQEAINYIAGRRDKEIISLKTSSFANLIQTDLIDLNPDEDIIVLSFSLEMVGFRQVGRTLSNKLRKTTSTLYSSEMSLDDDTFRKVVAVSNKLKEYQIYFVDNPTTPMQVEQIIKWFYEQYVKNTGKYFVVIYDHALLTKPIGSVIETISELERVFIQIKKLPRTSVIQIAQMNRNIESSERINNPLSHYPMRSDLSSSDAIFQASDYVLVIHRPEILNIQEYGQNRLPTQNKVYIHILKNRDAGKPCILEFENDLMYNNLIET